ncbi:hypothetical protein L1987_47957 [Smallanthus sonchifolius]|uniref:Uncharacterized protein n=1 Tax=Smallanthus sonchifolius TaxID=185202 RepID=A0ACB9FR72_9ASTR|nr:hypothetical protein L1987_47957 [Smallanthus sonchifolius]
MNSKILKVVGLSCNFFPAPPLPVHLQGLAEAGLERLHQYAEKEISTYLNEDGSQDEFNNFITTLAGLTR